MRNATPASGDTRTAFDYGRILSRVMPPEDLHRIGKLARERGTTPDEVVAEALRWGAESIDQWGCNNLAFVSSVIRREYGEE